jgi:hypothetical protein
VLFFQNRPCSICSYVFEKAHRSRDFKNTMGAPEVPHGTSGTKAHAVRCYRHFFLPHSSSASRFNADASEFFILSQSGERPERYIESLRFETMPSRPILQACAKTVGPSPSICSLALGGKTDAIYFDEEELQ